MRKMKREAEMKREAGRKAKDFIPGPEF